MIAVIGCGNRNRRDDGAGPEVLRLLAERGAGMHGEHVRLLDAGTDGMAVMFAARGCGTLIVVDACRSGAEPGAVFEVPGALLEQRHQGSLTLHDFRWDHALYAGRAIYREDFPSDVMVLLIEAAETGLGIGLSPAVADAVQKVAMRIGELVMKRLAGETGSGIAGCGAFTAVVTRGSVYLSREICDSYFAGLQTAVLLRRGDDLLVLPVRHAEAGGYILKLRNIAGDRVLTAPEFFRSHGVDDNSRLEKNAVWSAGDAALVIAGVFGVQT